MTTRDDLGIRMKEFYEQIPKTRLMRRTPVAIRVDGKAFHTFTRGFKRPFDDVLVKSMQDTMQYLCENIQGCVLGYQQSDEITLILVDYKKLNSSAWFDYEVQKMCSISASMATMAFNKFFSSRASDWVEEYNEAWNHNDADDKYEEVLLKASEKGAMFDARVFNIPKEEVTNLIYWRQLDATRNSIQMVGQANFTHKELQGKSCNKIQDMLMVDKGINWNDFPVHLKRGSCCIKEEYYVDAISGNESTGEPFRDEYKRTRWVIDNNIPIFNSDGRYYIDKLINFESEE